jgi:serine/threonine-protein phosphatase 2B regulatory subunit
MGNASSGSKNRNTLKQKEIEEFVATTNFTATEIKGLFVHFSQLASEDKKSSEPTIKRAEFQSALGMKSSTFVDRLFGVFDENGDGGINFEEFLTVLSVLSPKATAVQKLEVSFKLYDMDGDGKIGRAELTAMLRATADEHSLVLNEAQLDSVIQATFDELPQCKGAIDFKSYSSLVAAHPTMLSQFTLNVSGLVADGDLGKGWREND